MASSAWVNDDNAALLTDLYELTMASSYFAHGMRGEATFELFIRHLPEHRNFLISAGLDDALTYLERFRFDADGVAYMRTLSLFDEAFLAFVGELRFTGEVWAIPEGDAFFADEPLLRVTAPLIEAQIVETFLLNCLNLQTMVASKAARIAIACGERGFVDFSPRRDHGADAAMKVARASYIAGAAATSNVLAGRAYGIPLSGTMAHSYVMSFDAEVDAFRAYARDFPGHATLLIDTYDTLQGARHAVAVAKEIEADGGPPIAAVRLDSGDLAELAVQVRAILDDGGCGPRASSPPATSTNIASPNCWLLARRSTPSASARVWARAPMHHRSAVSTSSSRTSTARSESSPPRKPRGPAASRSIALWRPASSPATSWRSPTSRRRRAAVPCYAA